MIKPKRVLQIVGSMNRGGAETLIMNLFRHLNKEKVKFDFIVHTNKICHYENEIINMGGKIFRLPHPRAVGVFKWYSNLKNLLREQGPFDGIHCHMLFMSGMVVLCAKQSRIPIRIAHAHNSQDSEGNSLHRRIYRLVMKRLILRYSTHIFGCSPKVCKWMFPTHYNKDNRIKVLHNGIDLEAFEKVENCIKSKEVARKKLSLPLSNVLIGHVGSFRPQKNHTFLVEIFSAIKKQVPNCCLVMVGDGPLKPKIEEIVKNKGLMNAVHFVGLRQDVPEILKALDLFLFPSLYEGLPLALIEAQAAGIPFVTTDTVYNDADLKMGLGKGVSLKNSIEVWVNKCIEAINSQRVPEWETRKKILIDNGYDIRHVVKELEGIYTQI